jgi:hypothetical protein
MDLFSILDDDQRIVVLSSQAHDMIYTWDQSYATLQAWGLRIRCDLDHYDWVKLATRVLPKKLRSYTAARRAAQGWHSEIQGSIPLVSAR